MPLPPPRRPLPERNPEPEERRPLPPVGPPPEPPKSIAGTVFKIIGFVLLLIVMLVAMLWQSELPNDTKNEVERIRGYARMNPFPPDAKDVQVVQPDESRDGTLGIRFKASEKTVEEWLAISPGTKGVKGQYEAGGITRYVVPPDTFDPEARQAEIRWHRNDGEVWIAVSAASKSILEKARQR